MNHTHIIDHPLIKHSLSILRGKDTGTEGFRRHADIISHILIMEVTKCIQVYEKTVLTPLSSTQGFSIQDSLVFVSVLRSGIAILIPALDLFPSTPVGFIGLERDEKTAIAHEYYIKFPSKLRNKHILILDPMLATGGSLVATVSALKNKGAKDISAVCMLAAPEGIDFLHNKHPQVNVYTTAVDSHLNDSKCIVPGLGDFGDRYFGT